MASSTTESSAGRIDIDGLEVIFPFQSCYPEQREYMLELKKALDAKGHCVLEMPTGTGKTVALLSLILAYQWANKDVGKLIYCTRTVPEMEQVLDELKQLVKARVAELGEAAGEIVGLGLSARRNMCTHPEVSVEPTREAVDRACRELTAPWTRDAPDAKVCDAHVAFHDEMKDRAIPAGIYTLQDMKAYGEENGWCPYFVARHAITLANVVVYNYGYLLDPKIAQMISSTLAKECIVVFDEAHNIDNVCIEVMSVTMKTDTLDACQGNITSLQGKISSMSEAKKEELQAEYERLLTGLARDAGIAGPGMGGQLASPLLPQNVVDEAVPGNIRQAKTFVELLKSLVYQLKQKLQGARAASRESTFAFLNKLSEEIGWEGKAMEHCSERMRSLLNTLEIVDVDEYTPISLVCDFATLLGKHTEGFALLLEPYDERYPDVPDPTMQLACLDASIAIAPVLERLQTVVLTSGTISVEENLYPKILKFDPVCSRSIPLTLQRNCICPMIVARGSDQVELSSSYDRRGDEGVLRNYGKLLLSLAQHVPDGIIVFFVSYISMEQMISFWNRERSGTGGRSYLARMLEQKLVFIETPDMVESSLALRNFRHACDAGRGAIFMSVARGKVAEGVNFEGHYGRAVVMLGVPYQYTQSKTLRARLESTREKFRIREADFLAFDAVRQASQCLGRVIRSKSDYGLMILADVRYNKVDKRKKLPTWIQQVMPASKRNLPVDLAVHMARQFLREMARPQMLQSATTMKAAAAPEAGSLAAIAEADAKAKGKGKGSGAAAATAAAAGGDGDGDGPAAAKRPRVE
jgi:DNA excision repair protein ERCC-2